MRVTLRRATTKMEHKSDDEFERELAEERLAEERKFQDLFQRLLDDDGFIPHLAAVEEVLNAVADGGSFTGDDSTAKLVLEWLVKSRSTAIYWPIGAHGHLVYTADEACVHNSDKLKVLTRKLLCGGCTDTADFLMTHATDLGFEEGRLMFEHRWDDERSLYFFIKDVLYDMLGQIIIGYYSCPTCLTRVTKSLDFMYSRFDHVIETVRELHYERGDWCGDTWPDAYVDEIERWIQEKDPDPSKLLMNAMASLDNAKERIPEDDYLKITTDLQAYMEKRPGYMVHGGAVYKRIMSQIWDRH